MFRTMLGLVGAVASAAEADVAEWIWTVSDTGNGDGVIEPGESALLTVSVAFEPGATGFGWAGPYGITGANEWGSGTIEEHRNLLDGLGVGPGILDETTNTIVEIENLQLPPLFNVDFNAHNPIMLYSIRWRPDHYFVHQVELTADAPDASIYTDDFGTSALYAGTGGVGSFTVVPAPATFGVALAVFGLAAHRRRESRRRP